MECRPAGEGADGWQFCLRFGGADVTGQQGDDRQRCGEAAEEGATGQDWPRPWIHDWRHGVGLEVSRFKLGSGRLHPVNYWVFKGGISNEKLAVVHSLARSRIIWGGLGVMNY
jgi:hypothetical protein